MAEWFGEDPGCVIIGCIMPVLSVVGVLAILYVIARVLWWLIKLAVG